MIVSHFEGDKAKTSIPDTTQQTTPQASTSQQQQHQQASAIPNSNGEVRMAEDLTKLISRLETVTSRLENIAQHTPGNELSFLS